ncbi:NAD-dependent deacetylase sirtuin-like protein [Rhizoctonia solani AG-3 Rhs1AP]|uniref:NAD-dependent protein deacylase n=1 Tax=Rhizoctonia solani AG-3 Rhs1AP TaxID=1086054 RepID=X8JG69_9AGAM|nr:NAD-dependent deacetylase sirtuin-like protein [Rhizoctonia solani AG-3 Rhs1AP]
MGSSNNTTSFRKALQQSKHLILVAGAGLSAASGIPTFRGAGGYWRSFEATRLATPEAFDANPSLVWQFYHYRREKVLSCKPNNAHHVIARLLDPNYRSAVAPLATKCTLITQSVDGLSLRAQEALQPITGTPAENTTLKQGKIIEMHGRLLETLCTKCKHRNPDTRSPICPALAGTELRTEVIMDDAGKRVPEAEINPKDLPRCEKDECGGLLRPGVVWFGESIPGLNAIESLVEEADMCLVVGTSSVVYPAAGFAGVVQGNGGKVAVFNIEESQGDQYADFLFLGPCEQTLGEALGIEVPVIREP